MKIVELLIENQQAAFVQQNYDAAKEVGDQLGVDPKQILGHWALETGWGKSVIPGTNNLGNIMDFSGKGIQAVDNQTGTTDKYRQYNTTTDFAKDYASLLARKYPGVVGAGSNPDAFVQGLQGGKNKYAGDNFGSVFAGMPASVAKYLDKSWSMDPSKMVAQIQSAPADVKNYITKNFSSVTDFVKSATGNNTTTTPSDGEVEVVINGKKRKFKNKKEAELAMAQAQQTANAQGIT
jgi:hypothetical protein